MWRLDKTLTLFYAEARDKNDEMYKKTTLTSDRQGIQRHLDAITYGVVFVQFHWLTQSRDIQNI